MTPFEAAVTRALRSIADELRQAREERLHFENLMRQKLDSALAWRDRATTSDMAQTNQRLSELEKGVRRGP